MSEFEAVGEMVTGAMAGRTVEPKAGEVGADGHTQERACLNCGTALNGDFCHSCGQHAHVHRTLSAFFHDLLHGVLHLEGKTWRTLPMLAWRPGELTRRYIDGERARFVSPMALFLFSVFLMFAVLGVTDSLKFAGSETVQKEMAANIVKDEAQLKSLRGELAAARAKGLSTAPIEQKIRSIEEDLRLERQMAKDGMMKGAAIRISDDVPRPFANALRKAADNPELFGYKLKSSAYKWSWALIPLSVPFLWLLFPFSKRFRLYDHTVFVTYSLCFMSLLVCLGTMLSSVGLKPLGSALTLIPPFHLYRQLKGAYQLSVFGALWRMVALLTICFTVLVSFVVLLTALGLFG